MSGPTMAGLTCPKLSETLDGPKSPDRCQGCGFPGWPDAEMFPDRMILSRWREHDEADHPTGVLVILCRECSDRLIEKHPRLYDRLDTNEPHPGAVGICIDCRHRVGVSCPLASLNGGPGVTLTIRKPARVHICRSPRRLSGWITLWSRPATACDRREGGPTS